MDSQKQNIQLLNIHNRTYPAEPNAKIKKLHEIYHLNFNSLFHSGNLPDVNPYGNLYELTSN